MRRQVIKSERQTQKVKISTAAVIAQLLSGLASELANSSQSALEISNQSTFFRQTF